MRRETPGWWKQIWRHNPVDIERAQQDVPGGLRWMPQQSPGGGGLQTDMALGPCGVTHGDMADVVCMVIMVSTVITVRMVTW